MCTGTCILLCGVLYTNVQCTYMYVQQSQEKVKLSEQLREVESERKTLEEQVWLVSAL